MSNKPIVHAPIATGSTEPRDIRDRFADMPNVKDFGAVGDGTTDDTAAFTAAQNSGATAVMVPKGTYNITQDVSGTFYSFGYVDVVGGGNVEIIDVLALNSIPIGTVLWLSTPSVPAGYLLCNGSAVSRAAYPELFTAIGTTYGAGDGSTTFNLPNLIDKFAQGSAVAGTVKTAGLPNITGHDKLEWSGTHSGIVNNNDGPGIHTGCFNTSRELAGIFGGEGRANNNQEIVARGIAFDASKSNGIYGASSTVQPPALTLLPCIKAFSSVVGDATVVAGQLVNDIQSKVALDGSNASAIGKTLSTYMAHAAMPDLSQTITVSLPYTTPADGYILASIYANPLTNTTRILCDTVTVFGAFWDGGSNSIGASTIFPVNKGMQITSYGTGISGLVFAYANGSRP